MNNFYNNVIVKLCQDMLSEPIMEDVNRIINSAVTYNDYQHLWKDYLQSLQSSGEDQVAFKLELDAWYGSFFDYLQENSDLLYDNSYIYNFLEKLKGLQNGETLPPKELFWNESVNNLIKIFGQMYDIDENGNITFKLDQKVKLFGNTSIALEEIRKADAGFSFDANPYVRPNVNIDNQAYSDLRIQGEKQGLSLKDDAEDFVKFMLNKEEHLQFTQSPPALEKNKSKIGQLRLIMPKYSHRVSVEDLNRNFWVIGQALSGVCAYLFNNDSPLSNFFKKAISELAELWENMLYLWSSIATEFQEDVRSLHVEHLLMPINEFQNKKYDDTGSPFNLNDWIKYQAEGSKILDPTCSLVKNLKYLKYKYPKSQLCIVPFLREDYYKIEHYKNQRYFGIVLYDRFKDEWSFIPINFEGGDLKISVDDINNTQIGCLRKDSVGYLYAYPFSDVETEIMATPQQEYFYAMLRLDLNINVRYDNGFIINGFNIKTYDAATEAVDNVTDKWIDNYYNNDEIKINDIDMITIQRETISAEKSIVPVSERNFNYGYYIGELVSNYKQTLSKEPAKFVTLKIGAMMPVGIDELDEYGNNKGAKLYETAEYREINHLNSLGIIPDANDAQVNDAYKEVVYGKFDLHLGHFLAHQRTDAQNALEFNNYEVENGNKKVKFMAFASVNGLINPSTGEKYEEQDSIVNLKNLNQDEVNGNTVNYYNCYGDDCLQPCWVDYEKIDNDYLKVLGSRIVEIYCKNFYNKDEKRMFFITKMSGRYWMGDNGSQWSWGRYCHMYIASPTAGNLNEFDIVCVGLVNKKKIYDDVNEGETQADREKYYGGMLDSPFMAIEANPSTNTELVSENNSKYLVNLKTKEKFMRDYPQAYYSKSASVYYGEERSIETSWRQVTFFANLVSYKNKDGQGEYIFNSPYVTIKDYNKIYYRPETPDTTVASPLNNVTVNKDYESYNDWTEIARCKLFIGKDKNDKEYNIEFISDDNNQLRAMHCVMDGIQAKDAVYAPTAINDNPKIDYSNYNGFLYSMTKNGRVSSEAWNGVRRGRDGSQPWDTDIFGLFPLGYMEDDDQYAVHNIINHTAPLTIFHSDNNHHYGGIYNEIGGSYIVY